MDNLNLNELINLINNLSEEKQRSIVEHIIGVMSSVENKVDRSCNKIVKEHTFKSDKPDCPHCKAQSNLGYIIKKGYKGNNTQRYYCKACKHYFVATTNTAFERTRKESTVWEKFIHLTITGKSLQTCSIECKIAYKTAFIWRHKILNAFRVHQNNLSMSGKIEVDETFFPVSFKGNHIKGSFTSRKRLPGMSNNLPRESYKRGSDNRSKSPYDKACVFCMIKNGNEMFYADVPGLGFMKPNMLDATLAKHVNKGESVVVADQYRITQKYLEENGYDHVILSGNLSENPRYHRPEIKGEYHLQHVNAMHHHIRDFMKRYCGVSTKYLANYIALYTWLKNVAANKQKRKINEVSLYRASTPDCYITRKAIEEMPAIPKCA